MELAEAAAKNQLMPDLLALMEQLSDEMIATAMELKLYGNKKFSSTKAHRESVPYPFARSGSGGGTGDLQLVGECGGSAQSDESLSSASMGGSSEDDISGVSAAWYAGNCDAPFLCDTSERGEDIES